MITTRNAIIASAFPCDDDVERKVDNIFKRKHPVLEQNSYLLTDDIKSKLDWIENAYWPENHFPKGKCRGAEGSAKYWLWWNCSKARKSCMTRRTKNPSLVHWVPCEFYFDAFRMCSLVVIVGFCYLNIIRRDYLWRIIFINISCLIDYVCNIIFVLNGFN